MTDSTTRPPRTNPNRCSRCGQLRSALIHADPATVHRFNDEAEAAAPDAGLREKVADLLELLPVPQDDREYARAVEEVYVALAAHRSSDPSPATCPECGRVFEIIPHVHDGVTYSRVAGSAVDVILLARALSLAGYSDSGLRAQRVADEYAHLTEESPE